MLSDIICCNVRIELRVLRYAMCLLAFEIDDLHAVHSSHSRIALTLPAVHRLRCAQCPLLARVEVCCCDVNEDTAVFEGVSYQVVAHDVAAGGGGQAGSPITDTRGWGELGRSGRRYERLASALWRGGVSCVLLLIVSLLMLLGMGVVCPSVVGRLCQRSFVSMCCVAP